jgi:hypothetical protein
MISRGDLFDKGRQEFWLRFDGGLQALKTRGSVLGVSRGVTDNGGEDGHGTAIDIDERLRDYKVNNLLFVC